MDKKERKKIDNQRYRLGNKEKIKVQKGLYYQKNKEKINEKNIENYYKNRGNDVKPRIREDLNKKKGKVLGLYKKNYPVKHIAKLMGCDFSVIKRILQENNIEIRPINFYTKGKPSKSRLFQDESKIIDMYLNQDIPGNKISKKFNCDNSVIYDILNRNNIQIKGVEHFNKGKPSPLKNKTYEDIHGEKAKELRKKVSEATKKVMEKVDHRKLLSEIRKKGIEEGRIIIPSGKNHHLYEKTYEEIFGVEGARTKKMNMSKSNTGKVRSEYVKKKTSATKQGIPIEEWKGFVSFEPYGIEFNKKLKKAIRERDGCCMLCNIGFDDLRLLKKTIHIHHINYDKKMSIPQNCVSLCSVCHGKTNSNRKHWIKFFQSLLNERYDYKYSENQEIILNLNKTQINKLN